MKIIYAIILLLVCKSLFATEKELYNLIEFSFKNERYYNAITESLRYQYLYDEGEYQQEVLIMLGKSYFEGGNFLKGLDYTNKSIKYSDTKLQAEAYHNIIYMKLIDGSAYSARESISTYFDNYTGINKDHDEKLLIEQIYSYALTDDFKQANLKINKYKLLYPEGQYNKDILAVEILMTQENSRPKKNSTAAFVGSIFIPGFSHFYTGNYKIGIFSFLSNAVCISLLANSIANQNMYETVFFSLVELTFYQYSLYSSYHNVYNYNNNKEFKKQLRLSISERF